ncbi:MAG: hypothetical protein NTW87_14015 [Planctomycetota bacterium]|nr:hypothetical protein [Planctomycetota bacterium]
MKKMAGLTAFAVVMFALAAVSARAEDAGAKEMKGSAGCAMCQFAKDTKAEMCAPAVKVGDTVYTLKASEKADEATQKLIKSFAGAKKCVDVTIKGVVKEKIIVADAVALADVKKPE